jgi:hypothetical protein
VNSQNNGYCLQLISYYSMECLCMLLRFMCSILRVQLGLLGQLFLLRVEIYTGK